MARWKFSCQAYSLQSFGKETGRYDQYGSELLRFKDRHDREFCYGPTHEEVITDIARRELQSYKQLPVNLYQIQTKFRDEIRPRFGVMRGREFIMKDSYSFHSNQESLDETYQVMYDTYHNILNRMGLDFRPVQADTGSIGGSKSHEFQILAQTGEDVLAVSTESQFAANIELLEKDGMTGVKDGDPSPDGKGTLKLIRGIEVGHIFQLGTKYSHAMGATVLNPEGKKTDLIMGCYGLGVTRIVAAAVEQNHDDNGIIWPEALAPFDVCIVPINFHKSPRTQEAAENLLNELETAGFDVLLDDRKVSTGFKFRDMDLIGIPNQLILGERGLDEGIVEYKHRKGGEAQKIKLDELVNFLKK